MLELQDIVKSFSEKKAVQGVSLSITKGSIFGLLGPNGAGKTTLIRIITHIIGQDSGTVFLDGRPLQEEDQSFIGYMPEERGLYKKMKVWEQLIYLAQLKGLSNKEAKSRIQSWLEKFDIEDWKNKKIEELSKGMQQKVQFISTVVHQPKLVILDEPFSGLDPVNTNLIKKEIFELKEKGTTVIFSTHRMEQVEEICDHIALINEGEKILDGKVSEIKQRYKKNQYQVCYDGKISAQLEQDLQVLADHENNLLVQASEKHNSNAILSRLLQEQITIHDFNELLPSLNEVFISLVESKE